MSRTVAVVALVCAAGVIAWFALGAGAMPGDRLNPEAFPHSIAESVAESKALHPQDNPADKKRDVLLAEDERVAVPVEVDRAATEKREQFTIRVVDKTMGRPVPGAEVFGPSAQTYEMLADLDHQSYFQAANDIERLLERNGDRYVCDSVGEVKIDRPQISRRLNPYLLMLSLAGRDPAHTWTARSQGRYGENSIRQIKSGFLEIEILRDRSVEVIVRDHGGRLARGVAVALEVEKMNSGGLSVQAWRQETDEEGRTVFRHLQQRGVFEKLEARVAMSAPGVDLAPAPLDLMAPPHQPILFHLPPTGAIEVQLLGLESLAPNARVGLSLNEGDWHHYASFEKGSARFRHVGLGILVELELLSKKAKVPGPSSTDEVVTHIFDFAESVIVTGRALDGGGNPLVSLGIILEFTLGTELVTSWARTDKNGEFTELIKTEHRGFRLEQVEVQTANYQSSMTAGMLVRLSVDRPFAGVVALGDLQLKSLPVIAKGRVVNRRGESLLFSIQPHKRTGRGAAPMSVRKPEEGRFEIRGEPGTELIEVDIYTQDGQKHTRQITRGEDVELVVTLWGKLSAQIVHPGGDRVRVKLDLVSEASGKRFPMGFTWFEKTELGTRASWKRLEEGRYRLEGRVPGASTPFVEVDGIEIGEGDNHDARLDSISIGDYEVVQLEFVDEAGNPVSGKYLAGLVFIRRSRNHWEAVMVSSEGGLPLITVPRGGADLRICMQVEFGEQEAFDPVLLKGAHGKVTVRLAKEKQLRVPFVIHSNRTNKNYWVNPIPVFAEPVRYTMVNESAQEITANGHSQWQKIVVGEASEITLLGAGTYEFIVREAKEGSSPHQGELQESTPARFSIPVGGVGEPLTVHLR